MEMHEVAPAKQIMDEAAKLVGLIRSCKNILKGLQDNDLAVVGSVRKGVSTVYDFDGDSMARELFVRGLQSKLADTEADLAAMELPGAAKAKPAAPAVVADEQPAVREQIARTMLCPVCRGDASVGCECAAGVLQLQEGMPARADLRLIQDDIRVWKVNNFGMTKLVCDEMVFLNMLASLGALAHSALKRAQGIRGDPAQHEKNGLAAAEKLAHTAMIFKRRGFERISVHDNVHLSGLFGIVEELGELADAILAMSNPPTAEDEHRVKDAVGDTLVYLLNFCSDNHVSAECALNDTWATVSKRNWKANKATGVKDA